MFNRLRAAYYRWHLRLIEAEIASTEREQNEAESATEVLDLESYLCGLRAERCLLRAKLIQLSQPT